MLFKGKVDFGEMLFEIVVCEIVEEIGLIVGFGMFFGVVEYFLLNG